MLWYFHRINRNVEIRGEFIPSLPEGDFAVDTRVLPGSNLKTSTDAVQKSSEF